MHAVKEKRERERKKVHARRWIKKRYIRIFVVTMSKGVRRTTDVTLKREREREKETQEESQDEAALILSLYWSK